MRAFWLRAAPFDLAFLGSIKPFVLQIIQEVEQISFMQEIHLEFHFAAAQFQIAECNLRIDLKNLLGRNFVSDRQEFAAFPDVLDLLHPVQASFFSNESPLAQGYELGLIVMDFLLVGFGLAALVDGIAALCLGLIYAALLLDQDGSAGADQCCAR